ncbi:MAG TPA: hypothetical protein VNW90_23520 [Acetobacteraceae bacterium]|jgi:hypothetical protein|nr:hypothetical protein [Acetobacteraceae bacterium]
MAEATPMHDWLSPRLLSLVREAEQAGFDRAAVVAAITDLITMPPFNDTVVPPEDDE